MFNFAGVDGRFLLFFVDVEGLGYEVVYVAYGLLELKGGM